MPVVPWEHVSFARPPRRCLPSTSAFGPFSSGDGVILLNKEDDETLIGVILKIKKWADIPLSEHPDVSDEKLAENRNENGGYFAQILWYYAVDEFDGLRDKVEAAVPNNHGSKPCSFLQHIKNREVVISNHFDWMPGSQLVDVIEVHDWSEIAEGLLDISGRVTAFWMRCRMDVTDGVDNARVTALDRRRVVMM